MSVKDALAGSAVVVSTPSTTSRSEDEVRDQDGSSNPLPAPSNAVAAPSPKTTIRKGLQEALNQYQKDLVARGIYTVADEYSIEFADSIIEQAKITVPNPDFKNTSPQAPKTGKDQLDKNTQKVDPNSRILTITAGQQIVQVIDQAVRNSSYIRAQQKSDIDENTQKQKNSGGTGKNVAWFKINMQATPIKFDPKRNDYAYKIKYTVSPYRINQTNSNYFATPEFRGVHKQYNYWFTGQNTQVLNYEQTYNALYTYVLSGGTQDVAKTTTGKLNYQPRSGQSSQGADLRTNEPAANLADSLYNPADLATANLTIVGDPAWLQQGEASFAPPIKGNFNSSAFLSDGTINFDSQQILFEIILNNPTDYNMSTGIMDVNKRTGARASGRSYTYIANECTSEFVKGKFTQNIKGTLLQKPAANSASGNGRSNPLGALSNLFGTSDSRNTGIPQSQADAQDLENGGTSGFEDDGPELLNPDIDDENDLASPQPAAEPEAPNSSGDIDYNTGFSNDETDAGVNTEPQDIAREY
jgi:hypothetical protein